MVVERPAENLFPNTQGDLIRPDVVGNFTKGICPTHGEGYFERVKEGENIFRCAHADHKGGFVTLPIDPLPGGESHLQR